jgi:hypothetical protein
MKEVELEALHEICIEKSTRLSFNNVVYIQDSFTSDTFSGNFRSRTVKVVNFNRKC